MIYTSRGMRRRGDSDKWEVVLSHHDPLSSEQVPTYHTVEAKTEKQAKKKRDELILELERKGAAATSKITVREFMEAFINLVRNHTAELIRYDNPKVILIRDGNVTDYPMTELHIEGKTIFRSSVCL